MSVVDEMLVVLRASVAAHAGAAFGAEFGGLRVSRHVSSEHEHELASPMCIPMVSGAPRLSFARRLGASGAGAGAVVPAATPLSGP